MSLSFGSNVCILHYSIDRRGKEKHTILFEAKKKEYNNVYTRVSFMQAHGRDECVNLYVMVIAFYFVEVRITHKYDVILSLYFWYG